MKIRYRETFERLNDLKISSESVFIGFDAVVDHLCGVVRSRDENGNETLFSSIGEFGGYLQTKSGMSCCLELKTTAKKIGGNMAVLSQAMSALGARVECVGTLGDEGSAVYGVLAQCGGVYSIAPYGSCTALEFRDGKVMLAENASMRFTWRDILEKLGEDPLKTLLARCGMICLVNWAELLNANNIWRGLLDFAVGNGVCGEAKKTVFFDMADFSHRAGAEIIQCAELIAEYGKYFNTVLGLNENEARLFARALSIGTESVQSMGSELRRNTCADTLVIHTNSDAYAFDKSGEVFEGPAFHCRNPLTLTGAGDNFNAGYCAGLLMGLPLDACVLLGNACSGYYVRNGESAGLEKLKVFIKDYFEGKTD